LNGRTDWGKSFRGVEPATSAHDIPQAPWQSAGLRPRRKEIYD